tara:strand:+ start:383 stop:1201 length:819 start_codon:yes stop_codon:yes gene_type:complete
MTQQNSNNTTPISQSTFSWHTIENTPLTGIISMDESTKAQISDEQLLDYENKYDEMKDYAKSDLTLAKKKYNECLEIILQLWGRGSKQYKYFDRQTDYDMKDTTVSNHYEKYATPDFVNDSVAIAKGKVSTNNSKGSNTNIQVDDKNMQSIDMAIKYLIQEGYEYGKDFTSLNAVNLAEVHKLESAMDTIDSEKEILECETCKEEGTTPEIVTHLHTKRVLTNYNRDNAQVKVYNGYGEVSQKCYSCCVKIADYKVDLVEEDGIVRTVHGKK